MAGSGSGSETQMRDTDLFQAALGLGTPWSVSGSRFDAAARRLDIEIAFAKGARFACPLAARRNARPMHEPLTWRHLNFFQHEAYLTARVPRVAARPAAIRQVSVPWARAGSGFTLLFEALVMALVAAMPVAAVARMVGEHDTKAVAGHPPLCRAARARADHGEVRGLPSTKPPSAAATTMSRCSSISICAQVLFVADGKDAATVGAFAADLRSMAAMRPGRRGLHRHEPGLHQGHRRALPQAAITFDKFHAVKIVNDAVDQVRREEQRSGRS